MFSHNRNETLAAFVFLRCLSVFVFVFLCLTNFMLLLWQFRHVQDFIFSAESKGHSRLPSSPRSPNTPPVQFPLTSSSPLSDLLRSPSQLPSIPHQQPAQCTLSLTCACRRIIICHKIFTPGVWPPFSVSSGTFYSPDCGSGLWTMTDRTGMRKRWCVFSSAGCYAVFRAFAF